MDNTCDWEKALTKLYGACTKNQGKWIKFGSHAVTYSLGKVTKIGNDTVSYSNGKVQKIGSKKGHAYFKRSQRDRDNQDRVAFLRYSFQARPMLDMDGKRTVDV